jgi:DNA-binding beta-propeller fold protein YncE
MGNTVTPVNLTTGRRLEPIDVGGQPAGIAVTPDGKTILVSLVNASSVVPISVASRTAGRPITLPTPRARRRRRWPNRDRHGQRHRPDYEPANGPRRPGEHRQCDQSEGAQAEWPISLESNGNSAQQLAVSPTGDSAFALNYLGVRTVNLTTRTAGSLLAGTYRTTSMAMSPNGKTLYLGQTDESSADSSLIPMNHQLVHSAHLSQRSMVKFPSRQSANRANVLTIVSRDRA